MKHANIAVFVPHAGCPSQCSFCNQRSISGSQSQPTPKQVCEIIERAVALIPEKSKPAQIAFFGGSFTAIEHEYMVSLLQSVQKYIDSQRIYGIRISTRPDAINKDILDLLKRYNVTDIELGAQSMNNDVLQANLRGHSAEDTIKAANMIKLGGFKLGLQMMLGMYTDSMDGTVHTVQNIVNLNPDHVRIYPTVILNNTGLEKLYKQGKYKPLTLEDAVNIGAEVLDIFTNHSIPVIRMGLHDSPDLVRSILLGPHHPAYRELCENRILIQKTFDLIEKNHIDKGSILLEVNPNAVSKMAGQKRCNINELKRRGYNAKIRQNSGLNYLEVQVFQRM